MRIDGSAVTVLGGGGNRTVSVTFIPGCCVVSVSVGAVPRPPSRLARYAAMSAVCCAVKAIFGIGAVGFTIVPAMCAGVRRRSMPTSFGAMDVPLNPRHGSPRSRCPPPGSGWSSRWPRSAGTACRFAPACGSGRSARRARGCRLVSAGTAETRCRPPFSLAHAREAQVADRGAPPPPPARAVRGAPSACCATPSADRPSLFQPPSANSRAVFT